MGGKKCRSPGFIQLHTGFWWAFQRSGSYPGGAYNRKKRKTVSKRAKVMLIEFKTRKVRGGIYPRAFKFACSFYS